MLSWNFGDVGLRIFAMSLDNDNDLFLILRYIFHSSCWLVSLVLFYQFHYSIVFFHKASIYHPFWKRVYSSVSKDQNLLHQVPIIFVCLFWQHQPVDQHPFWAHFDHFPCSNQDDLCKIQIQICRWVCPGPSSLGPSLCLSLRVVYLPSQSHSAPPACPSSVFEMSHVISLAPWPLRMMFP